MPCIKIREPRVGERPQDLAPPTEAQKAAAEKKTAASTRKPRAKKGG